MSAKSLKKKLYVKCMLLQQDYDPVFFNCTQLLRRRSITIALCPNLMIVSDFSFSIRHFNFIVDETIPFDCAYAVSHRFPIVIRPR